MYVNLNLARAVSLLGFEEVTNFILGARPDYGGVDGEMRVRRDHFLDSLARAAESLVETHGALVQALTGDGELGGASHRASQFSKGLAGLEAKLDSVEFILLAAEWKRACSFLTVATELMRKDVDRWKRSARKDFVASCLKSVPA